MTDIPIDIDLKTFDSHLDINERTVFSASFGEGKTFFLNKFREKYKDKYEFITIYPVNYQIAENKTIFEYIKRDILIQMIIRNIIKKSYEIPTSLMIPFFIMNNGGSLLHNLMHIIPLLGIPEQMVSLFISVYKGLDISKKYLYNIKNMPNRYKVKMKIKF